MKSPVTKFFILPAVLIIAGVAAWQSSSAALGLGEARVDSFLGQTLAIRIGLLQPSEEALDSLTVEIASPEDHARLGVPTEALALGLRIELDRSVSPPVLQLRSTRPVNEPFLQVLINARWAGGRMLREYTLFLDPPTAPVAPPLRRLDSPVEQQPSVPDRRAQPATQPEAMAEMPQVPATPSAEPAVRTQTVGPVRAGQTLWSIAEAWRPDDSVTMNQVLLAILERNPQAFADNNVNRLLRGAELVMPDLASVREIAPAEALRRVGEQNAAWRLERDRAITPPPQTETARVLDAERQGSEVAEPTTGEDAGVSAEAPPLSQPELEAVDPAPAAEGGAESEFETPAGQARLELTAADEGLLTDAQSIGVEREQLERRLESLLPGMRSEDLDAPEIEARLDQIRQAIDSNDVGGLLVASESLALLEQQMRDSRLVRDRISAEVEAQSAAVSAPAGGRPGWLQLAAVMAIALLVLMLAIGLSWLIFKRRRARPGDHVEPAQRVSPVASTSPRQESAIDPQDARLTELRRLAETEDHEAFGSAFSEFHAKQKTSDDPRWREAVRLARALVPGHPLLLNDFGADGRSSRYEQRAEESNRGLRELLADREEDSDERGRRGVTAAEDASDLVSLLDGQEDWGYEDESPDLARLTNRLGSEDQKPDAEEDATIEDAEPEAFFKDDAQLASNWENPGNDGSLNLDFEFSSRRRDEAIEAGQSEDIPESSKRESPGDEGSEPELNLDLRSRQADEDVLELPSQWFDLDDQIDEDLTSGSAEDSSHPEQAAPALSDDDAEVKLDLARAYLSMDDKDSARALLEELVAEASSAFRAQARQLLDDLG